MTGDNVTMRSDDGLEVEPTMDAMFVGDSGDKQSKKTRTNEAIDSLIWWRC